MQDLHRIAGIDKKHWGGGEVDVGVSWRLCCREKDAHVAFVVSYMIVRSAMTRFLTTRGGIAASSDLVAHCSRKFGC